VFSGGRIEQVGSPSDVYERPETEFVAGFVGVSNILERDGRRITVRPEKIRILDEAGQGEPGTIREAVYVGMVTRYTVELDAGGVLQVVEQNLDRSSQDVSSAKGRRVRLLWSPENVFEISSSAKEGK
jgi:putative spermidine/putrescine transport system ATP-binding protein